MKSEAIITEKIARKTWVAKTKIWLEDKPEIKFDLQVVGETEQDAIDKLKKSLEAKP